MDLCTPANMHIISVHFYSPCTPVRPVQLQQVDPTHVQLLPGSQRAPSFPAKTGYIF